MAGSWNHSIDQETGKLLSNEDATSMLENGGDWYEYAEEVYGMVWQLASMLAMQPNVTRSPEELIEYARTHYRDGLKLSPGVAEEGALEDGEPGLDLEDLR